jgi:Cof subfamily protein (haloacid dehalogenase superfamily)
MTALSRHPSAKVSAVVADVDGTLLTDDKFLTPATQAAVAKLHAQGIIFSIISARPPRGMRMLLKPLGITTPICGFNGGAITTPDLAVITEHALQRDVARRAIDLLDSQGVQAWVFSGQDWLLRDPKGPYVGFEERTVGFPPTIVESFEHVIDGVAKIVGVSGDFKRLNQCEDVMREALPGQASVVRSQRYYLDVTHLAANKGTALVELSGLLAVPLAEIAVVGDGANDVAMFECAGLAIAMGNAAPEVQRAADLVTDGNQNDGFAVAIERIILGGDRSSVPGTITRTAAQLP